MTVVVDSAAEVARARAEARPTTYEVNLYLLPLDGCGPQVKCLAQIRYFKNVT